MKPIVRGSKGGGKGGGGGSTHTPTESPDSLRSRQYAQVVDLVSEGEIEGLVSGLQSVFLDDTPVQNSDGTFNFSNVSIAARNGTQSQSYIPGFSSVEAESAVSTEIKYGLPVVRSVSNANTNALRVTIAVPQLTYQNPTNGDLGGSTVQLAIDVQSNGGGFVPAKMAQVQTSLSLQGAYAVSTADITSAQLVVYWSGELSGYQTVQWQVNYRRVGDVPWSVIQSGSFAGSSYTEDVYVGDSEYGYYQTVSNPPTAAQAVSISLVDDTYEFQVVKYTGSGSLSFSSGIAVQWTNVDTISGKTTSRYQRNYRIDLIGAAPWDIRIRRLTADSSAANLQNATWWDSYTEIVDAKLNYPNSAIVALSVDSEQFQSIPKRGYEIRGMKIRIPSNYNPITRAYDGIWNGSFITAWSDNPAWCFYDMVTSRRYGLGNYVDESQVDKWGLYQIAQYCDELVDDGFGGQEPRFTCNLYLQSPEQAFRLILSMASIFRAMVFWASAAVTCRQDAPSDPVGLFTPANIIGGQFSYSGSSIKTRHTVALVGWNDPADRYRQKIEYVEDPDGITRYGIQQTEVIAVGCTSRGQAHRMGRWLLYTERMETETISFKTGLDGLSIAPGEIINTSDPSRAGVRMGGRVIAATSSEITIDAPVLVESGKTYTMWCVLPDGTVESRAATAGLGDSTVFTVSPAFSDTPLTHSVWVIAASDLSLETWRVVSISESEGTQADIVALAYRGDKYDAVENGLILEPLQSSRLTTTPATPSGLILSESLYLTGSEVKARITAGWNASESVAWQVEWRKEGDNWRQFRVEVAQADIDDVSPGIYQVRVSASNAIGVRGPAIQETIEVYGKTAPPADVENFSVINSSGIAIPTWSLSPDLDVRVGGRIVVRHTPEQSGAVWEDGYIVEEYDGNSVSGLSPLLTGTYMAKALDSSGNYSRNAVQFVATEGMVTGFTTVASISEDIAFTGSKSGIVRVDDTIQISGADLIDDVLALSEDWGSVDALGGILSSGEYLFANQIDCGSVAVRRFQSNIKTLSFETTDWIDQRTELFDTWAPIDGDAINDCDLTLFASLTDDDPSGAPTWGAWTPFFVSDFSCRAARFKALLTSGSVNHNIAVSRLRVAAKIPA